MRSRTEKWWGWGAGYCGTALGEPAWRILRDQGRTLGTNGIMNPEKLFPVGG